MQAFFSAVFDKSFPMIPVNPDSVKWLVTFCFWTLKRRIRKNIYGIQGLYEGPGPVWHSLTDVR
jgi:hypothetical protein